MMYLKLVPLFFVFLIVHYVYAQDAPIQIAQTPKEKTVEVGKQIQIAADLKNNQNVRQDFAYIVQIQNENGITMSLSWLTGTLEPGQSFSPAISWIPSEQGRYEATIFVWESVTNPTALSPTLSLAIDVGQPV